MITTIHRQDFTKAVLVAVKTCGKPVGLCEAPEGGGYQGEMGASEFIPYSVITPMSSSGGSGPFDDPQGDVVFAYSLASFAPDALVVEFMADKARAAAVSLAGEVVNSKMIAYVWVTTYGQVQRVDSVQPPYFAQIDQVQLTVQGG